MISIRKWLYKPRRDDKSLFAKFWYADDNLNRVAAELDSFDGRKDPERCAALVSRLRSCQDKLLTICNKMLEEVEMSEGRANREFRLKFPDEIVTENLGGQLWFGAECLAAGSSIMQKEFESEQMRPLAKAVTKTLEKVRGLVREQCLSPAPHYTEQIHETLKIFDRMFAEFEFSYVSCMVHVKTVKEYEIQQDVICLFSETLQRALQNEMISQDMIDLYDPSLMFAIPRLAIVCGLIVFPCGPLNVDRDNSEFPELFRPFKNLLRKIRELLYTLTPSEFYVLERLLCQLEEPVDLERKLQAAQQREEERQKLTSSQDQAARLDAKLTTTSSSSSSSATSGSSSSSSSATSGFSSSSSDPPHQLLDSVSVIPCACDSNSSLLSPASDPPPPPPTSNTSCAEAVVMDLLSDLLAELGTTVPSGSEQRPSEEEEEGVALSAHNVTPDNGVSARDGAHQEAANNARQRLVEIDCSGPDITVSPIRDNVADERTRSRIRFAESDPGKRSLKRRGARRYHKTWKDARARFKSSEDLIHRLYVCISGAADQLQTNFAGDFRYILKYVFLMNSAPDEEAPTDENQSATAAKTAKEDEEEEEEEEEEEAVVDLEESHSDSDPEGAAAAPTLHDGGGHSERPLIYTPARNQAYECGEDALMTESEQSFLRSFGAASSGQPATPVIVPAAAAAAAAADSSPYLVDLSTSPPAGLAAMPVYASNLDQALLLEGEVLVGVSGGGGAEQFYQPEPTLLTIAAGTAPEEEQEVRRHACVEAPPAWIPDSMAPLCMGCGTAFSLIRRRHHCRSCGRVFCQRCSPNQIALPRYGMQRPVRVCNRCYIYYMNPYEERTVHAYHVYNGTGHGSWGYSSLVS